MDKPQKKEDLIPSFSRIRDEHGISAIRAILQQYDMPPSQPVTEESLLEFERREVIILPANMSTFLKEIGPINFDGIRIYDISEIRRPKEYGLWISQDEYKDLLTDQQSHILSNSIGIGEDASGDLIILSIDKELCYLCSHDPMGFYWGISFDDLIRMAIIDLSWSYYGWSDIEIELMAEALKRELFGDIFKV